MQHLSQNVFSFNQTNLFFRAASCSLSSRLAQSRFPHCPLQKTRIPKNIRLPQLNISKQLNIRACMFAKPAAKPYLLACERANIMEGWRFSRQTPS